MRAALVAVLYLLLFGASSAHLAGNTTRLCLQQSPYFVHLHTVQTIAQGESEISPNGTAAPAFILSSQFAQNSSSTRHSDVQIFFGFNSSLPGPFEVWNETSFFHDPNAALWAISSTQSTKCQFIRSLSRYTHNLISPQTQPILRRLLLLQSLSTTPVPTMYQISIYYGGSTTSAEPRQG